MQMEQGERHGYLTAIKFIKKNKYWVESWLFACDCGNKKVIACGNVRNGHIKSCSCIKTTKYNGESVTNKRFFSTWKGILKRCYNKNAKSFCMYGEKGIKCDWTDYKSFKKDMYKSYVAHIKKYGEQNTSTDRINNIGNYG